MEEVVKCYQIKFDNVPHAFLGSLIFGIENLIINM